MKRLAAVILLALSLGLSASGCSTRPPLREEIEATYARWNSVSEQKDVDGLLAMLHPDFEYTDETGHIEAKSAFGVRIRQAFSASRNIHYGTEIQTLEDHDDEATSKIIYSVQMEYQKGDEWVPVQYKINSREKFVRVNGRWMLRSSQVLK